MAQPLMCPPELFEIDLSGQVAVVTGANSGIGFVTARQLAAQGATVVLACRNTDSGESAARAIRSDHPNAQLQVRKLDLADLSSVDRFAATFLEEHEALGLLINNAGVMNTPNRKTADGFELQFGANHLGHFFLTEQLLPALERGAPSRIVIVSSCFHDHAMKREGDIHFDDLHFERGKYDGWKAYAQSKLANLLHARELAKRLEGKRITAVSVHPGWVRTKLIRNSMPTWVQNYVLRPVMRRSGMIEPWEGAQTSLYAALSPEVPSHNGAYFSQTGAYRDRSKNRGGWPLESPNPHALDDTKAARLYDVSEKLIADARARNQAA